MIFTKVTKVKLTSKYRFEITTYYLLGLIPILQLRKRSDKGY